MWPSVRGSPSGLRSLQGQRNGEPMVVPRFLEEFEWLGPRVGRGRAVSVVWRFCDTEGLKGKALSAQVLDLILSMGGGKVPVNCQASS